MSEKHVFKFTIGIFVKMRPAGCWWHPFYDDHHVIPSPTDPTCLAIPLRDKFDHVVEYALIDSSMAQQLLIRPYSCRIIHGKKYACSGSQSLHSLVYGEREETGMHIDHQNGNSLDCRRANLVLSTIAKNIQNCNRKTGKTTSLYKGVSKENPGKGRTDNGRWRAGISIDRHSINLGSYTTELEAALVYDIYAVSHHGINAGTNGLLTDEQKAYIVQHGIPEQYRKVEKSRDLPEFISTTRSGTYRFRKKKWDGTDFAKAVKTLDEAIALKEKMLAQWKLEEEAAEQIRRSNITRNSDGIAVVYVKMPDGDIRECLVDDHTWPDASRFSLNINVGGYPQGHIDSYRECFHLYIYGRFVGPIPDGHTIDHINGDKLDARISNLRPATQPLQSHNREKYGNNLDRFKGVSFNGHTFTVVVGDTYFGAYPTEEQAATVANQVFSQIYGSEAKLNEVPDTQTTKHNRLLKEEVTRAYIERIGQIKELEHLVKVLGLNQKNGGPYKLTDINKKTFHAVKAEILSNKFKDHIGITF